MISDINAYLHWFTDLMISDINAYLHWMLDALLKWTTFSSKFKWATFVASLMYFRASPHFCIYTFFSTTKKQRFPNKVRKYLERMNWTCFCRHSKGDEKTILIFKLLTCCCCCHSLVHCCHPLFRWVSSLPYHGF